jgi:glycosyltransferase involved in cell wall biosynthesis
MPAATMLHTAASAEGPGGALPSAGDAAKPHICFVAPYAWPVLSRDASIKMVGGAEVQQVVLARLFRRNGYRVSMICQDFGQPSRVEVDGIAVHKVFRQDEGLPVLRFLYPRLAKMWRALREVNADIYYQRSTAYLTGVIAEFCRRHGKRSIYAGASNRDFTRGHQQLRFARDRWLYDYGLARVDRIVVQNTIQQESCREEYHRDAIVIPSCYEPPEGAARAHAAQACDRVLWVGTIHDYKRPELLLDIAERLPQRRFVMIGGAAAPDRLRYGYYEAIRDRAARLPNVEFKGFLPLAEVEQWFDRGRILVNTSVYEGMPNIFLQAWARGIPTIATVDVGARLAGQPFYKVFSETEQAVEEIERLFEDRLHFARASARSREYFAATHSSAEVLERYGKIFEELAP